jgi:hypothetical protein
MFKTILYTLLFCSSVVANPVDQPSKDWKALRGKNIEMGFSEERVDRAIGACRENGLSVAEAEDLFCPVYDAHAGQLPTDCVFLKIEEGLVKGAPWKTVHVAADQRLSCLRQADRMVMKVRERRGGQHGHLVSHICLALESGLSVDSFEQLLSRPGGFRYGRLIHVVEAGEALKLAGLSDARTLLIMNDCLDRDLTGAEVMRVVDVLQVGLGEGQDFETIHSTLWASADQS